MVIMDHALFSYFVFMPKSKLSCTLTRPALDTYQYHCSVEYALVPTTNIDRLPQLTDSPAINNVRIMGKGSAN